MDDELTLTETARLLDLPDCVQATYQLAEHVSRLPEDGSRNLFCRHVRLFFRELGPWPEDGPSAADLMRIAVGMDQTPASTLIFITHIQSLMYDLGKPLKASLALDNLKARLSKVRNDGRLIAIAIGEEQGASVITVDQLVPDPTASLRDAVEDLAIRAMTSWQSRPGAGAAVPMRLISRWKTGYVVEGSATKTTLRDMFIPPELVLASNRVAAGIPGRHRLGIDHDDLLKKAKGYFIPALDKDGRYRGPGEHFERHWFGKMLKRRVSDWCERNRLSRNQTELLLKRISGKAGRRGGQTDNVYLNRSLEDCTTLAHFESPHLTSIYSEGMDVSCTRIAHYVTSRAGEAFRKMGDRAGR